MFAVPEVDDDIDVSTSVDITKSITQPGETKESFPSASVTTAPPLSSLPSLSATEKVEKNSAKIQIPPPPPTAPPVSSKQHRSRRSLFHRNTIHICDQIGDRM